MEVFLVPYRAEEIDPQTVNEKDAYDYRATQTVLVDIKYLPHLHIGSFWKNKRFVGTPFYSHCTFSNLLINRTTSYITDFRANKHLEGDKPRNSKVEPLLPINWHPSIEKCLKAKYLVIDRQTNSDPALSSKLIIPCIEITRFYYTNSPSLSRAIITGAFDRELNLVYNPERSWLKKNGSAYLLLRRGSQFRDANFIARIFFPLPFSFDRSLLGTPRNP